MAEEQNRKNDINSANSSGLYGVNMNASHSDNTGIDDVDDHLLNDISGSNKMNDSENNFREETAAEIAAPTGLDWERTGADEQAEQTAAGTGVGVAALILAVLSLFVAPVLFGGAGLVLGFIARARGAQGLGSWAIGISVVSLVFSLIIAPFF